MLFEFIKMFFMIDFLMYRHMLSVITKHSEECIEIYEIMGFLDTAISLASFRKSLNVYSIPEFTDTDEIAIRNMVHPLVTDPVANSIILKRNSIITGSNASGKSTFVKAVAVNTILAQTIHTCLAEHFSLKPSFVVTSMAVSDSIQAGDSYYIAEIKSLKRILDGMNNSIRCLCFIDEILKGTNTIERIAASAAVLDYLKSENCLAVIATHDIELTEMAEDSFDNYHFQEQIGDDSVNFDYKIHDGRSTTKNAIRLLEFMDYNQEIIVKANALARDFEKNRVWEKL
jgi:DNA mismatch repair ATPase MutS